MYLYNDLGERFLSDFYWHDPTGVFSQPEFFFVKFESGKLIGDQGRQFDTHQLLFGVDNRVYFERSWDRGEFKLVDLTFLKNGNIVFSVAREKNDADEKLEWTLFLSQMLFPAEGYSEILNYKNQGGLFIGRVSGERFIDAEKSYMHSPEFLLVGIELENHTKIYGVYLNQGLHELGYFIARKEAMKQKGSTTFMLKKYNGHLDNVKQYRKFVFLDLKESDQTPITAKDLIDLGDASDLLGEQDFRMTAANIPDGQNYSLEGENSSDLQSELLDFSKTSGSGYVQSEPFKVDASVYVLNASLEETKMLVHANKYSPNETNKFSMSLRGQLRVSANDNSQILYSLLGVAWDRSPVVLQSDAAGIMKDILSSNRIGNLEQILIKFGHKEVCRLTQCKIFP